MQLFHLKLKIIDACSQGPCVKGSTGDYVEATLGELMMIFTNDPRPARGRHRGMQN